MDKKQLEHLFKAAKDARRIGEMYNFTPKIQEIHKLYSIQNSFMTDQFRDSIISISQSMTINLPIIDLSHFNQSLQASISKIDFTVFSKNIGESVVKASLLSNIYEEQIQGFVKALSEISLAYASNIAKIRANAFLVTSALESIRNIPTLNYSFAAELATLLQRTIEATDEDKDIINEFENLVENKIKNQPNSKASLELIMFILTVLSFLTGSGQLYYAKLQYDDGKQSSQSNDQRFNQLVEILERIANNLENTTNETSTFYIVNRTVELKLRPKFKSSTIAVLYPNQQVRLVQNSDIVKNPHKWVYVEYFDYLEGIPKYGWANKKYLIKVEKSK
jgi:hypothetical protein